MVWKRGPVVPGRAGKSTATRGWSVEVVPDAGQVGDHGDAKRAKQAGGPDAGALEDGRAGVSAGRQHHPAGRHHLAAGQAHAGGGPAAHLDPVGHCAAADGEVGAAAGGGQVGQRGAHPDAGAGIAGHRPRAHGAGPVVIGHIGQAVGARGFDERCLHRVELGGRRAADRHRALRAMPLAAEVGVSLQPAEERQHFAEAPARVAHPCPAVVVSRCPPQGEAPVGRRASADELGAGQRDTPPQPVRLRDIAPVVRQCRPGGVHHVSRQVRHAGQVRAGFQQGHLAGRILTQPRRQHAPSRAATHHQHISHAGSPHQIALCSSSPLSSQPRAEEEAKPDPHRK